VASLTEAAKQQSPAGL